jgi:hypothetical protein
MNFKTVFVYDSESNFLGFSILKEGAQKLHTANLWQDTPEEVKDLKLQLDRLNDDYDVRNYWPDVREPEVQALLNDPTFEPLKLHPVEVVDDEKSVYVWIEEPNDENPYGKADPELSVIVYKNEYAPAPVEVQARVKKACEIVARNRAKGA